MGRWFGVLSTLFLLSGTGCISPETRTSARWWQNPGFQGPSGPDVLRIQVALIEVPLGDPYVNEALWTNADERTVGPERRASMEASGFRSGLVSGSLVAPPLQELLTSPRNNPDPRDIQTRMTKPILLSTGPLLPRCRFVKDPDDVEEMEFPQAQCRFAITASPAKDGRVTLQIVPQILYGEKESLYKPTEDRSALVLEQRRPLEELAQFSWEMTVGMNDYLVVGGRFDQPGTVGHQFFVRPEEARPVQRLLLVRLATSSGPTQGPGVKSDRSVPLALQAEGSSVRRSTGEGSRR